MGAVPGFGYPDFSVTSPAPRELDRTLKTTPPQPEPPAPAADYDPRYLGGVVLFNRGDFFDAHDIWEELWQDCPSADRRFYQSLIQAAVALYHWGNGNRAGAARLFRSGRRYMEPYRPTYRGIAVDPFWNAVGTALAPALDDADASASRRSERGSLRIELTPPPAAWPGPDTPPTAGADHE